MTRAGTNLWEPYANDARTVALLAWEKIAHFYRGNFEIFEKQSDGPATEADIMADRFIVEWLQKRYPSNQFGYLSEEAVNGTDRLKHALCWIIDPIDGTSDFIGGREDFAVQVGLAARMSSGHYEAVVGVVYQPVPGLLYRGWQGGGAWRDNLKLGSSERLIVSNVQTVGEGSLVITRSKLGPRMRAAVAALQPRAHYQAGSLGVKVAHVAEQRADAYITTSRRMCKEWDTCAPHAILREAGGELSDLRGNAIHYNKPDVYIEQGVIASNGKLHAEMINRLASVDTLWSE